MFNREPKFHYKERIKKKKKKNLKDFLNLVDLHLYTEPSCMFVLIYWNFHPFGQIVFAS